MTTRILLVTALVAAAAARVHADPRVEAKKHVEKATAAYGQSHYDEALAELTLAYSLDPQPSLLYAIGQVHVKLGHCTEAIDFYQRFLATRPAAGPAGEAQQAIETCKKHPTLAAKDQLAQPEGPTEPPQPPPPPKPTPAPVAPAPSGRSPFYTDALGDALVGAGIVAGAIGVVEYTTALGDLDKADKQTTYGAHQKLVDDANSARTLSIVFGAGAAVLVGAGVTRYLTRDPGEPHGVAIVPSARGGIVAWSTRF